MEEIFSLGEDVDSLVVVGYCLVEDVALGAVVHFFHDFFLTVDHLIWFFLVDVALEVVLVVGLPRSGAHVAEVLAAGASHEVAAHRPLDRFFAPGTHLSVGADPLRIRLLSHHLFDPIRLLLAFARIVIV